MGRPLGSYEYSYQFRGGDEIIPLYPVQVCSYPKGFLFEVRTKFNLKTRNNNIKKSKKLLVGSERFAVSMPQQTDDYKPLQRELSFRLKPDYWMSFHEIQSLARQAFDFATRHPRAKSSSSSPPLITAVVVELDVCTVQREGETARAVASRAIRPEHLVPIYVWPLVPLGFTEFDESGYLSHKSLFWEMPRVRLENDGQTRGACPVCSRDFAVGDQVYNSLVPSGGCQHACHSHCLLKSFRKRRFECPSCHVHVPGDGERRITKRLKQVGVYNS